MSVTKPADRPLEAHETVAIIAARITGQPVSDFYPASNHTVLRVTWILPERPKMSINPAETSQLVG